MAIKHDIQTVSDLVDRASIQKLVLPNFQRDFVWTPEAQRTLVASALTDVPVGSVLILNGHAEDYSARQIGLIHREANPPEECQFLLDGQQRISTLLNAFASPFFLGEDWEDVWKDLPAKLRYVWSLRVRPDESEEDPFGWRNLRFPRQLDLEPGELADFISFHRVMKKDQHNEQAWYHPNWASNARGNIVVEIAKASGEKGHVPLWGIESPSSTNLASTALQITAAQRQGELQAEFDNSSDSKKSSMYETLCEVSPTLPEDYRDASSNEINASFSQLAAAWKEDASTFLKTSLARQVPCIILSENDLHRAVAIFEVINQGGTPLSPFDLIVARHAKNRDATNLAQLVTNELETSVVPVSSSVWPTNSAPSLAHWRASDRGMGVQEGTLSATFKGAFLNLLSVASAVEGAEIGSLDVKHIKRSEILKVAPAQVKDLWGPVTNALSRAWCFLQLRCGVRSESDLRYKLMVLPIAFCLLRCEELWDDRESLNKLEYWYWSSLFGGSYRERQNENTMADIKALYGWLAEGGQNPFAQRRAMVLASDGYSDMATLIPEAADGAIGSDVGVAVLQYTLSHQPADFILSADGSPQRLAAWGDEALEDHHVIPLQTASTMQLSASLLRQQSDHLLNSPLNRTYISKTANRAIGPKSPSQYLTDVSDGMLSSHFMPSDLRAYKTTGGEDLSLARDLLKKRFEALRMKLEGELDNDLLPPD